MTLDEFLSSPVNNAWVEEPGFSELYLRKGRLLVRVAGLVFDEPEIVTIATVTASNPGGGAFTALVERLGESHAILVENVLKNERFEEKLISLDFVRTDDELPCYWREKCGTSSSHTTQRTAPAGRTTSSAVTEPSTRHGMRRPLN